MLAKGVLVTEGPYAYVRHPQYSGLFLVTDRHADSMAYDYHAAYVPGARLCILQLIKERKKVI